MKKDGTKLGACGVRIDAETLKEFKIRKHLLYREHLC